MKHSLRTYFYMAIIILLVMPVSGRSVINEVAGLAIAQTSTIWNNIKDAAAGDNLTNGLLANVGYMFDGTNFDRMRGDTANGLDVDVTRVQGNVTVVQPAQANLLATVYQSAQANLLSTVYQPTASNLNATVVQATAANLNATVSQATAANLNATVTVVGSGAAFYAIKKTNLSTSSSNLAFGFTSKKVMIETPASNSEDVCIDWIGGTAVCPATDTAGDDRVPPGRLMFLEFHGTTSISAISASGTQTIVVRAWN